MIYLLSQAAPTTSPTVSPPTPVSIFSSPLFLGVLLLVVFYIFVIRGNKKKESARKGMLSSMKKGDRVQTIGGILAAVHEVRDDRILLKVDENSNTKIWFSRSAIQRVVDEEKAETPK